MEDVRMVTEEDLKNLFWQQTLHSVRQDKLIKALHEKLREQPETNDPGPPEKKGNVIEFKANA